MKKYVCRHPVIYLSFLPDQSAYWDITEYFCFIYVCYVYAAYINAKSICQKRIFLSNANPLIFVEAANSKKKHNWRSSRSFFVTVMNCRIKLFYIKLLDKYWRFDGQYATQLRIIRERGENHRLRNSESKFHSVDSKTSKFMSTVFSHDNLNEYLREALLLVESTQPKPSWKGPRRLFTESRKTRSI